MRVVRSVVHRLVSFGLEWGTLFVLWLLYVSSRSADEVVSGIGASGLAAVASESVRGQDLARFYPATRWVFVLGRLPLAVVRDCWQLTRALALLVTRGQPPVERFQEVPFPAGGDDARSSARRALATAAISLPPGSFVIGIDPDRNRILLHTLPPGDDALVMARMLAQH